MSKAFKTFTEELLTRAGSALSELLNHPIAFTHGELAAFHESSLAPFGEKFIACLTAAVTEPHAGTIYVGFDLPRVVVLGALLEMVPPEGIGVRLAEPKFDSDSADAFEEVGNILVGKLDEAIRDDLGAAKIHTKKGKTISGAPAEVFGQIHANGDYYCLDATITIEGQESGPVCFLFHPPLVEEGFKADPEITRWRIGGEIKHEEAMVHGNGVSVAVHQEGGEGGGGEGGAPIATANGGHEESEPHDQIATAVDADDGTTPAAGSGTDGHLDGGSGATDGASTSPANPPDQATPRRPRTPPGGRHETAPCSTDGRPVLLVVDDDITTRSILRTWLDGEDLLVYEAVSWHEASLFLRHHRIDVVLLDLYLHDLSGIEACRRLHLHPVTRDVPVILSASHPSREAIVQGLKAGATDFLIKPFDRQRLMEKLAAATLAPA